MAVISIFTLVIACAAAALSLAVALRVKKILDPLVEQGALKRPPVPKVGDRLPATHGLVDGDGEPLSLDAQRSDSWFLVFVSTGCSGCAAQLPDFERFLTKHRICPERVVVIVLGSGEDAEAYRKDISRFGRVAGDQEAVAELTSALGVSAFPTFLHVNADATVAFSSTSVSLFKESVGRWFVPGPETGVA
jgi:hypothetical protein